MKVMHIFVTWGHYCGNKSSLSLLRLWLSIDLLDAISEALVQLLKAGRVLERVLPAEPGIILAAKGKIKSRLRTHTRKKGVINTKELKVCVISSFRARMS